MRTTEELLEGKVAAPVYKPEINDRENPLRWPRDTLYPQKLSLTSPTSGGRSVGIVRSRTKATEFSSVEESSRLEDSSSFAFSYTLHRFGLYTHKLKQSTRPYRVFLDRVGAGG
jgi:hypothetical protein